jgi:arylsulfatase A-like enzyme
MAVFNGEMSMDRRAFLRRGVSCAAGLGLAAGWARQAQAALPPPDRVFLITIDTLRPDHLDFHGYVRPTTPFLSGLAKAGQLFDNAYTACNNTNPAHASLFTGLHLPQHGVMYNGQDSLSQLIHTLPELFHEHGYASAGFASVLWMQLFGPRYQHFQTYQGKYKQANATRVPYYQANETVDNVLAWTKDKTADDKFLTWVHVYDPHDAKIREDGPVYHAPEEFNRQMAPASAEERKRLLDHWVNTQKKSYAGFPWNGNEDAFVAWNCGYDAEIAFVDRELERLYRDCERRGLTKNSLWIITSDHGEGLGSHGYQGHGMNIYQEQLRVPLFFYTPGESLGGARRGDLVQHIDIVPTFIDWLGAKPRENSLTLHGKSLLPLFDGRASALGDRDLFAMRRKRVDKNHSEAWEPDPVYCVLDGKHKYIKHNGRPDEFFDLIADPHELKNLIDTAHPKKDAMKQRADTWYAELVKDTGGEAQGVSEQYREDLKALGYLGGDTQSAPAN